MGGLIIELGKPKRGDAMAESEDAAAAAGLALAKAIKGGDGRAIADAFADLRACCDDEESMEDEDE